MAGLNWRCVDNDSGEKCPHKHHSQQSARNCARTMGFENFYIESFDGREGNTARIRTRVHEGSKAERCGMPEYNRKLGKRIATQVSPEDDVY